jgi:lysophospholipase L1-like esterase
MKDTSCIVRKRKSIGRLKLLNPDEGSAITILGFGDSLTAGTPGYDPDFGGDERSQYGFWLLESSKSEGHHHVSFVNQGVPGELAQLMQGRLERLLQQKRYDAVIILGGSNDIGWGCPVHAIFAELELWPARFRPLAQSSLTYK